jgi:hypothetical protein
VCSRPVSARLLRPIHSTSRVTRPWSARTSAVHAERDSETDKHIQKELLCAGGILGSDESGTQTQAQTEAQAQTAAQTQTEGERRWGEKSSRALTAQSRLTKPLGVCCTCMAVYARIHLCLLHTNTSQVKPICLSRTCAVQCHYLSPDTVV